LEASKQSGVKKFIPDGFGADNSKLEDGDFNYVFIVNGEFYDLSEMVLYSWIQRLIKPDIMVIWKRGLM
jgi:hypothetical protein